MITGSILNIQRYCIHDGPGIRTTVFFKGCPLRCMWCSNPTTQNKRQELAFIQNKCVGCMECADHCPENAISYGEDNRPIIDRARCTDCGACIGPCKGNALQLVGEEMSVEDVLEEVKKDMPFFRNSGGGVTLSGGEVLMQPQFAKEILRECNRLGIHTAIETSGHADYETVREIVSLTKFVYLDLKHLDEGQHTQIVGCSNATILRNVQQLTQEFDHIHIRIPVIPGLNDSKEHLAELAKFVATLNVPSVELLPYHRLGESKYASIGLPYPLEDTKTHERHIMAELVDVVKEHAGNTEVLCNLQ